MVNKLPSNWETTTLSQLAKVEWGNTSITKKAYVNDGYLAFSASGNDGYLSHYEWNGPAIILSAIGARCGRCFLADGKWTAIKNTIVIKPYSDDIEIKFLFHFLNNQQRWLIGGSGQPFITLGSARDVYIPIAPKNEQHRIAGKLEKLLTKVDQCQERLEKIPGILKRLRTAIIAGACAGTLSSDWREMNPSVQGAAHVLEDNNKKRTQKYQKACREAEQAGKPKPREYRTNQEPIDDSEYKWLPETWKLERLCNIAQICGGVTKGRKLKNRTTITLPYLRVANVQDGYLDLSEIKHIEALPEDLDKYGLKKGDVLFTEGGDRDKLGRGSVWNDEIEDCIHQNHVFRARLYSSSILPEYVSLATKSEQSRNFFFKNASQTVNLASINMTSLGNLPIPIPPYEEQKEIIKRVKRLYEIADQLEKRYSKAETHIDNLTQSILAKAFRGELVPQDPDDEPAAELLERIKKEKERQSFRNNSKRNSKNPNQKKKARA